jgi:hypothetical protein
VYDILLLRWSRVQYIYDLAIYQESRDVQRMDEFFETLQWNVCHPDVSSVHLFVEDDGGRAFMQRHMQSPNDSPLIDVCSKVVFHDLGRTMRYSDSVKLANERMSGHFVLIMHADVYAGIIFSYGTTEFMLNGTLRMYAVLKHLRYPCVALFLTHTLIMFGLTRHERPTVSRRCVLCQSSDTATSTALCSHKEFPVLALSLRRQASDSNSGLVRLSSFWLLPV